MQVQTQGVKNIKKFVNINMLLVMGEYGTLISRYWQIKC